MRKSLKNRTIKLATIITISIFLFLHVLMGVEPAFCQQIKRGKVTKNEEWEGKILVVESVIIPNGIVVYEHESPNGPYYGSLLQIAGADANAYMRIFGTSEGDAEGKIPPRPGAFRYNTWNAMQLVIQEMFETRTSPQTGEDLLEKLTMFLLAFRSALERGGAPVRREEIAEWELPPPTRTLIQDWQPTDSAFRDPYSEEELEAAEKRLG